MDPIDLDWSKLLTSTVCICVCTQTGLVYVNMFILEVVYNWSATQCHHLLQLIQIQTLKNNKDFGSVHEYKLNITSVTDVQSMFNIKVEFIKAKLSSFWQISWSTITTIQVKVVSQFFS